jgi:hypothetical protein
LIAAGAERHVQLSLQIATAHDLPQPTPIARNTTDASGSHCDRSNSIVEGSPPSRVVGQAKESSPSSAETTRLRITDS